MGAAALQSRADRATENISARGLPYSIQQGREPAAPEEFFMARPDLDLDQDAADPQDQAETADETHLNEDADEFTTLEEALSVTADAERRR